MTADMKAPMGHVVCVVLSTAPSQQVADELAHALVESGVAACVNVVPGVRSHYRWEGRVQTDLECLLVIKTTRDRYEALESALRQRHPYEVPEIVALDVAAGWPPYLHWVVDSTAPVKKA